MVNQPTDSLRFRKNPSPGRPPHNEVDLRYDAASGSLKAIDSSGAVVPFNGSVGGFVAISGEGVDYTGTADSSAAVHAIIDAAIESGIYEGRLSAGTLKGNLIVPSGFRLIGVAGDLSGDEVPTGYGTRLIPGNASGVGVYLLTADSQFVGGFHIEGFAIGIKVGDSAAFAGVAASFANIRIHDCVIGVQTNLVVGCEFTHVHCNWGGIGWQLNNNSDTTQLHSCGANFNTGTCVDANSVRNLAIHGGEWGNGAGMWIDAKGSLSNISVYDANVESITNDFLIEIDFPRLLLCNVRIDVNSVNPDVVSCIRQSSGSAEITIINPVWLLGTPGYLWEGVTTMRPPKAIGCATGTYRFATNNTFTTTLRTMDVNYVGVQAYKTSNQTITTGTPTVVTWSVEVTDSGGNFDPVTGLFTAPVAGWYQLNVAIFLNDANANYTRIFERKNGTDGQQMDIMPNHPAFAMVRGACSRYLAAGDTWGVAISHDKGSNLAIYATGGGQDGGISIVKISD